MIDGASGTLCLVVTDITRENPSILNHLLDDMLMPCPHPGPCVSARIGRFEGREDGALWWHAAGGPRLVAAEAIRTLVAGLPQPVRDWRAVGRPDRLEIRLDGVDPASAGAAGAQLRDRIDALGRRITSTLPSLALLAVVPAVEDGERLRVVAAVGGETGPGSTRGSNDASAPHVTCERQLETDLDRGVPMPRRSSPGPIPASGTAPATPASDT